MSQGNAARKPTRPLRDLLMIFAGPAIWFGHFSFIYAAATLICIGQTASADRRMLWIHAIATIAALASLGLLARQNSRNKGSLSGASFVLMLLSTLGVIWTIVPLVVLPVCASPN